MNVVVNTNVVSPHVVPLSLALKECCDSDRVMYIYRGEPSDRFRSQEVYGMVASVGLDARACKEVADKAIMDADILVQNIRDFDVLEKRHIKGRPTFYVSERWFKPVRIDSAKNTERAKGKGACVSGVFKLLVPSILKRAIRMTRILRKDKKLIYLANGVYAAKDMVRICGLFNGDWSCLFRPPQLEFEAKPGGRIYLKDKSLDPKLYCVDKMRVWGYFVSPGDGAGRNVVSNMNGKRVLWVGRMFGWKRIDTLIKAVGGIESLRLDIYGNGPEETRIAKMARQFSNITVRPSVLLSEVRKLMREHDVYVLPSNAFEGWGAVVNEALEEGMKVIGTYEAGASATMLPETNLYHAGDWKTLRKMLLNPIPDVGIGPWTAKNAARQIILMAREVGRAE